MDINERSASLAEDDRIKKTISSLEKNGIQPIVVDKADDAKAKVLEILPTGAEIMTMTSVTLDAIGIAEEINESGRYDAAKPKLFGMDRETQASEMRQLGAAPDWVVGSVHAVTEAGQVVIVSATGSQLPAYAYGAGQVVWVVGSQKLVGDLDEAMKRIYEFTLPLEDERAMEAYGMHSGVNKVLIVNSEAVPGRITMIIVKDKLGF